MTKRITDKTIKNLKPQEKPYKFAVGDGLYLRVTPGGGKLWRYDYRFAGRRQTLAMGEYPKISLASARETLTRAKVELMNGRNPGVEKRKQKRSTGTEFGVIAKEWWGKRKPGWVERHAKNVWQRLKENTSSIWYTPLENLEPKDVLSIIRKIEERGSLTTAVRIVQDIGRICRYGIRIGVAKYNPAADLTEAIETHEGGHHPFLSVEALPGFLRDFRQWNGRTLTKLATRLQMLTFPRSSEICGARWKEFDLTKGAWIIPGKRMKMNEDHIIPLSHQAIAVINELKPISSRYDLLFPSEKDYCKPMSPSTLQRVFKRLGYDGETENKPKAVPHGWRSTASSVLNEQGFNPDAIERQLSHKEKDDVRAAYNHAKYLKERRNMMQFWADYLDKAEATEESEFTLHQ